MCNNNWGGGNKDGMLSDAFVRREIEIGARIKTRKIFRVLNTQFMKILFSFLSNRTERR